MFVHERDALALTGFPESHWPGFKSVAVTQECVIVSRAVGPVCTGLIEEGYAMKSFRIHGKSCDWGPMAGFVLRDPRLQKIGMDAVNDQRKEHRNALEDLNRQGWTSGVDPVKISDQRLQWLRANNAKYKLGITFGESGKLGAGQQDYVYLKASRERVTVALTLLRESASLWGLYIDHARCSPDFKQEGGPHPFLKGSHRFEALMGMTNPYKEYSGELVYKNVVTGDYDLFALWPKKKNYRAHGADRRLVGVMGGAKGDAATLQIFQHEHLQIGNITDRVFLVCQMLNSVIGAATGLPNRNVCFHSDEAGRPAVNEIDAPLIAFVPTPTRVITVGIPKAHKALDLKLLILMAMALGYKVTLHNSWAREMNMSPAITRSFVPRWDGPTEITPQNSWYFPDIQVGDAIARRIANLVNQYLGA